MIPALGIDPVVLLVLRGGLVLLFGGAAVHKLRDVTGFRRALAAYEMLPSRLVGAAAALLIAAEATIVVGFLLPQPAALAPATALAAAALLGLYTSAIGVNLRRGRRGIDCGCMGVAGRRALSPALVVRNVVLMGVAVACALPTASPRPLSWIDAVTVGAALLSLVLLYAATDGLIANAPRGAALARPPLEPARA